MSSPIQAGPGVTDQLDEGARSRIFGGYQIEDKEDETLFSFGLPSGKKWRKRIWPRKSYPKKLFRWITAEEILSYLTSFEHHEAWISTDIPDKPPSGTVLFFDKRKTKDYRKDGYDWKTRRGSESIREDRMKLKVSGCQLLYGCYTHSASNPNFHRRSYWLIQDPNLIMVHYLEVDLSFSLVTGQEMEMDPTTGIPLHLVPTCWEMMSISDCNLCALMDMVSSSSETQALMKQLPGVLRLNVLKAGNLQDAIEMNNNGLPFDKYNGPRTKKPVRRRGDGSARMSVENKGEGDGDGDTPSDEAGQTIGSRFISVGGKERLNVGESSQVPHVIICFPKNDSLSYVTFNSMKMPLTPTTGKVWPRFTMSRSWKNRDSSKNASPKPDASSEAYGTQDVNGSGKGKEKATSLGHNQAPFGHPMITPDAFCLQNIVTPVDGDPAGTPNRHSWPTSDRPTQLMKPAKDYNPETFSKFAHSLVTIDPLDGLCDKSEDSDQAMVVAQEPENETEQDDNFDGSNSPSDEPPHFSHLLDSISTQGEQLPNMATLPPVPHLLDSITTQGEQLPNMATLPPVPHLLDGITTQGEQLPNMATLPPVPLSWLVPPSEVMRRTNSGVCPDKDQASTSLDDGRLHSSAATSSHTNGLLLSMDMDLVGMDESRSHPTVTRTADTTQGYSQHSPSSPPRDLPTTSQGVNNNLDPDIQLSPDTWKHLLSFSGANNMDTDLQLFPDTWNQLPSFSVSPANPQMDVSRSQPLSPLSHLIASVTSNDTNTRASMLENGSIDNRGESQGPMSAPSPPNPQIVVTTPVRGNERACGEEGESSSSAADSMWPWSSCNPDSIRLWLESTGSTGSITPPLEQPRSSSSDHGTEYLQQSESGSMCPINLPQDMEELLSHTQPLTDQERDLSSHPMSLHANSAVTEDNTTFQPSFPPQDPLACLHDSSQGWDISFRDLEPFHRHSCCSSDAQGWSTDSVAHSASLSRPDSMDSLTVPSYIHHSVQTLGNLILEDTGYTSPTSHLSSRSPSLSRNGPISPLQDIHEGVQMDIESPCQMEASAYPGMFDLYRSSSSLPSSPSLASVSSRSTASIHDAFSDSPSVFEMCELLGDSANVQLNDFSHMTLSELEQKQLFRSAEIIQNAFRKYNHRRQVRVREKNAALLIENYYKSYRELKQQKDQAARRIQHQYRVFKTRKAELNRAALFIQQMYRYHHVRHASGSNPNPAGGSGQRNN